jgi:hypothetical protein
LRLKADNLKPATQPLMGFTTTYKYVGVPTENSVRFENAEVTIIRGMMVASTMNSVLVALFALLASSFRDRAALQAEILALRHQLAVLHKNAPPRREL